MFQFSSYDPCFQVAFVGVALLLFFLFVPGPLRKPSSLLHVPFLFLRCLDEGHCLCLVWGPVHGLSRPSECCVLPSPLWPLCRKLTRAGSPPCWEASTSPAAAAVTGCTQSVPEVVGCPVLAMDPNYLFQSSFTTMKRITLMPFPCQFGNRVRIWKGVVMSG